MDNMDENLKKKTGGRNPFKVPEGYFETLTERVVDSVGKSDTRMKVEPKSEYRLLKTFAACAVAACLAGVLFFAVPIGNVGSDEVALAEMSERNNADDEDYQKEVLNYAMLDNDDVYTYLAGNGY